MRDLEAMFNRQVIPNRILPREILERRARSADIVFRNLEHGRGVPARDIEIAIMDVEEFGRFLDRNECLKKAA